MTWFSLTPLVFLTPYVWDLVAHFVRKCVAVSETGRSAARPVSGTAAIAADSGGHPTEHVPVEGVGVAA